MSDPLSQPASTNPGPTMSASGDGAWRDLARSALRRLKSVVNVERFFLVEKADPAPEARRLSSILEALAPETSMADVVSEEEVEAALEAGEDLDRVAAGRDRRTLATQPRPAALQALVRLCRTFPATDDLRSALAGRGAITVLETGDTALIAAVADLLNAGEVLGLSVDEVPYVTTAQDAVRDGKDGAHDLWTAFSPGFRVALERGRAMVIVTGSAAILPRALRELSPVIVRLAPLDAEVLLEHLRHSHSETRRIAEVLVRPHLPPDATLGHLRMADFALALRAGTPVEVVQRIGARLAPVAAAGGSRLVDFPMEPGLRSAVGQMLADLRDWQAGRLPWSDVTRGLLLVGPPGSGKTEVARLLADEAGVTLHASSVASWHASGERYSGFMRAMSAFFARAASSGPSIVFIDELDAIGDRARAADHNSSYTDGVVAALLEQLDGVSAREGVIMLAATNHAHKIDAAIRRPGRFDRTITLWNPSPALMPKVVAYHLRGELAEADLSRVAAGAAGMSGADVAALVRAARARARREARALRLADLDEALAEVRQPISTRLRRRIAIHEAGHAVAAVACGLGVPTMIAITDGAGMTEHQWGALEGDAGGLMDHVTCLLAGREAERLLLGDISAGAGGTEESDLARATEIAAAMEVSYGLGQDGPLWRSTRRDAVGMLSRDAAVRARVRARLDAAEERARAILAANRATLERIAAEVEQASAVQGPDLSALLAGVTVVGGTQAPEVRH